MSKRSEEAIEKIRKDTPMEQAPPIDDAPPMRCPACGDLLDRAHSCEASEADY